MRKTSFFIKRSKMANPLTLFIANIFFLQDRNITHLLISYSFLNKEDREKKPKDWSGIRPTFQPAKRAVLES